MARLIEIDASECGAHKTTRLIQKAQKLWLLGESVLIVQPSIDLVMQTASLIPNGVAIHSKQNNDENVSALLSATLVRSNTVIIITHQQFLNYEFSTENL